MNPRYFLLVLGMGALSQLPASSVSSLATAGADCIYSAVYLRPDSGTVTQSFNHSTAVSGPNLADGNCPSSVAAPPLSQLTPQSVTLVAQAFAESSGDADYGHIQGYASAQYGLGNLDASGRYTGSFDDSATITGASGIARFVWRVDGSVINSPFTGGSHQQALALDAGFKHATPFLPVSGLVFPFVTTAFYYQDVAFLSGDTIPFGASLNILAFSADAATLRGDIQLFIQYYEFDGVTPLTGHNVTTMSGTQYAESPEPGTMLLMGAGFCLLGAVRRRRLL
jgi:hypothetical protein